MMKGHRVLAASLLVLFGSAVQQARSQDLPAEVVRYADVVLFNGSVLTMDRDTPDFTVAQAIAVRDGTIIAIGDTARIVKMAGPQTKKIDLAGKAVMPGVVDTHSHPNRYAVVHYQSEFLPGYVKYLQDNHLRTGRVQWEKGKAIAIEQLKAIVAKAGPHDLIYANSRGNPVIMNLTELDDVDAKRIVDFAAGLVFGLRGSIERVTNKVFMLSPANVQVGVEAAKAQLENSRN